MSIPGTRDFHHGLLGIFACVKPAVVGSVIEPGTRLQGHGESTVAVVNGRRLGEAYASVEIEKQGGAQNDRAP